MAHNYKCALCGFTGPSDLEWLWLYDHLAHEHIRYCEPCALAEWPCPVRLVYHLGVPAWVKQKQNTLELLENLRKWFGDYSTDRLKDATVHYFHRREAESLVWLYMWDANRSHTPCEPYSYRGWYNGAYNEIVILVDETETPDSIAWITYHELGHMACNRSKMIDEAMEVENKNEGRKGYQWKDDAGHEADSEERLVNRVATAYMGGKEYARPWWRPRVQAKLAGKTVLPDPHAKKTLAPTKKKR